MRAVPRRQMAPPARAVASPVRFVRLDTGDSAKRGARAEKIAANYNASPKGEVHHER
jgi:hypothetical protein